VPAVGYNKYSYPAYTGYNGLYGYNGLAGYTGYTAGHYIGKREADSEPEAEADAYTVGQIHAGLPFANAVATGHAHNPGYIAYKSVPAVGYNKYSYPAYTGYNGLYGYNGLAGYTAGHYIGKREADSEAKPEAEADAYTIGQINAGLPFANALATGHAHNPGYIAYKTVPTVGLNRYSYPVYNGYSGFYNGLYHY